MAALDFSLPENTASLDSLTDIQLLQRSFPTTKCRFVRQGDIVHLLVYLNAYCDVPFLRVSTDVLYDEALRLEHV
ncbi:hypothetical protein GT360_07220 [Vibrio astriarenae]|uniref:Uncharacterized protein n=1 Tax=Vibrio astriarenae TaxID=1481923 RepID=A0A7Z2YDS3_9VIBR|nr:hypothetical protein [Vibrio astriarenae]QIA63315.1 hypothetical protein GT360_07195 [Vibrio astriarenae]QIA63320.1 hypothetical protein GT360_07220 [Vibrio astriarenae]